MTGAKCRETIVVHGLDVTAGSGVGVGVGIGAGGAEAGGGCVAMVDVDADVVQRRGTNLSLIECDAIADTRFSMPMCLS